MKSARLNAVGLLGGILVGFSLAVLLGYQASTYSKPSRFVRFNQWINPQSVFFPPFRMLEHLALSRWQPGQTVVIIAGNSIFNGVSQPVSEIWSQRLQEILGPEKYVVVNLSFSGGYPTEAGTLVAESLIRRGIPVLVVCNVATGVPGRPVGSVYGYYYWEGRAQSALLPYPPRDLDTELWESNRPEEDRRKQAELRRAAALNKYLYFQELWHHVGLNLFFTVWNFLPQEQFWRPRNDWPDPEVAPKPVELRFRSNLAEEMDIVRRGSREFGVQDEQGRWHMSPSFRDTFASTIHALIPPAVRPHLLMVLCQNAPYYRSRLTPEEQDRDRIIWEATAALWREQGIASFVNGADYEDADYNDRTHLTPSGGRKLAIRVAEEIRRMQSATNPTP
ncbi:MAG TPA: hypothetical protein VGD97_04830 [Lacunisphaera sp.]